MSDKKEPTHQDALVAKHQLVVNHHKQEEAGLAVELYQLESRREAIKKRLNQLDVILLTADSLDPKELENSDGAD